MIEMLNSLAVQEHMAVSDGDVELSDGTRTSGCQC